MYISLQGPAAWDTEVTTGTAFANSAFGILLSCLFVSGGAIGPSVNAIDVRVQRST